MIPAPFLLFTGEIVTKPVLLDLFCGAGGATKGYQRAGFYVIGVDLNPQPNYIGDEFYQADAREFIDNNPVLMERVNAVHASPPCQRYSAMSKCRPALAATYPDLIDPMREVLSQLGLPYVIENVPGAPMIDPVMLCGGMFGRELYRHRLFEASFTIPQPEHPKHTIPASKAGHWRPGTVMSISGNVSPIAHARDIMDIDWSTRAELAEAIPPYYTEYVGKYLMNEVG